jgi:hypothetical protein
MLISYAAEVLSISLLVFSLALTGCGGSNRQSSAPPPATPPPTAEFVYVANGGSDDVSAFKVVVSWDTHSSTRIRIPFGGYGSRH